MRRDDSGLDSLRMFLIAAAFAALLYVGYRSAIVLEDSTSSKQFGYIPDAPATRAFLKTLERPMFAEAGQDAIAKAKGVDTMLYRHADRAHRKVYGTPFTCWNQGSIGSCVSFGWGMGSYIAQSVDYSTGRRPDAPRLVATESIYGGSRVEARGIKFAGYSDGSYGGAAAKWVAGMPGGIGGILYRESYGDFDLSTYSVSLCKEWGAYGNGGKGDDGKLDLVAGKNPAHDVALVTDFEQAAAAIESGFPVAVCSGVGFASVRNGGSVAETGYASRRGSWAHCMVFISSRHAANDGGSDGLLALNSWGPTWISGPKWPEDQPEGSFWVDRKTVDAMLSGEDSFAIGGGGFRYRDLEHKNWLGGRGND